MAAAVRVEEMGRHAATRETAVWAGSILLAGLVYALDLAVPLGVANGVLYAVPVLLSLSSRRASAPVLTAIGCSGLTLLGVFTSPTLAEVPTWIALTNRVLTLVVIWGPVLYFIERRKHQAVLEEAYQELELRVQERTRALMRANRELEAQIVERQKAEEALRESQARLAGILDLAEDAVISVDQRSRIFLFNQGGQKMFGYTPEEVLGRPLATLLPQEVVIGAQRHRQPMASDLEGHRADREPSEVIGRRKDGSWFPAEASLSKLALGPQTTYTVILRDITERKRAEADLRSLAARLLTAQDEERRRISRDLHDDVNQQLAVLAVGAATLEQSLPAADERLRREIKAWGQRIAELSDNVRRLAYEFHPSILDDLGLAMALERYVEDFTERTGIETTLVWDHPLESFPRDVASCLYRVVQESLGNVAKHARARRALVEVTGDQAVVHLRVRDEGVGLAVPPGMAAGGGLGLVSMKERVRLVRGTFALESTPGAGTQVRVQIPLTTETTDDETTAPPGG